MDLVERVAIVVVLLIIVFSAAFLIFRHNNQQQFTSAEAVQFVINDLKAANPSANITVINVSNSTLKQGSFNIVLSIVYNATKPCPTLFIEGFDYPATGLVPSLDNLYTSKCVVYGLSDAPSYVISSPEIAIVRSYTDNVSQINNYVNTFGYSNTFVTAKFYNYLNNTNTHLAQSLYNVWLVRYRATNANYSVYAVVDSSGAIAGNFTNST